jgi:hypothetical protein
MVKVIRNFVISSINQKEKALNHAIVKTILESYLEWHQIMVRQYILELPLKYTSYVNSREMTHWSNLILTNQNTSRQRMTNAWIIKFEVSSKSQCMYQEDHLRDLFLRPIVTTPDLSFDERVVIRGWHLKATQEAHSNFPWEVLLGRLWKSWLQFQKNKREVSFDDEMRHDNTTVIVFFKAGIFSGLNLWLPEHKTLLSYLHNYQQWGGRNDRDVCEWGSGMPGTWGMRNLTMACQLD